MCTSQHQTELVHIPGRQLTRKCQPEWLQSVKLCEPHICFHLSKIRSAPQAPHRAWSPGTWSKTSWSCQLYPEVKEAPTEWCLWGCASSRCQMYPAPSSTLKAGLCQSQKHWNPKRTLQQKAKQKQRKGEMFKVWFRKKVEAVMLWQGWNDAVTSIYIWYGVSVAHTNSLKIYDLMI